MQTEKNSTNKTRKRKGNSIGNEDLSKKSRKDDDHNEFKTRFQKLFGHQNQLSTVQKCIQKYDHNTPNNDIFKHLVTQDFRNIDVHNLQENIKSNINENVVHNNSDLLEHINDKQADSDDAVSDVIEVNLESSNSETKSQFGNDNESKASNIVPPLFPEPINECDVFDIHSIFKYYSKLAINPKVSSLSSLGTTSRPYYPKDYITLIKHYLKLGFLDSAFELYSVLGKYYTNFDSEEIELSIGKMYARIGIYSKARECYSKIKEPDLIDKAIILTGNSFFQEAKYDDAIEYYKQIPESYTKSPSMLYLKYYCQSRINIGNSYLKKSNYEVARKYYDIVSNILKEKDYYDIYNKAQIGIAYTWLKEGDYQSAEKYYDKIKQIDYDDVKVFVGNILIKNNEYAQAREWLEQINENSPYYAQSQILIGNIFFYEGKYPQAREHYDNIEEKRKGEYYYCMAQINIGHSFIKENKFEEAEKYFNKIPSGSYFYKKLDNKSSDIVFDGEPYLKRVLNFEELVSKTIYLTESLEKIEKGKAYTISSIQDCTLSSNNSTQKNHNTLIVHKNTVTREEFGTEGIDVNALDHKGWTALHYAARNGNDNIVEMLLEHKADIINIQTSSGYTALHLAAINKHIAVITVLLNKGANINIANNDRYTPAHYLKYLEHLKLENLNIDHLNLNTDVNNMCLAVITRDISVVNTLLLTEGVDVNALDHKGWTALHYAARNGNDNIVEMLLEHKADIINIQTSSGSTALHLAAINKHIAVITVLLNKGANINIANNNRYTPAHYLKYLEHLKLENLNIDHLNLNTDVNNMCLAVITRDISVVNTLLTEGFDVNALDHNGWTALHLAARHGYDNIVEMLLEHKADIINIQTSSGSTALHLAAINKHIAVITVLLNKGANINIANNDRYTPAHYLKYLEHLKLENLNIDHLNLNTDVNNMCLAVITRDISVVNTLLLTEGVDVNALDHKGWTALHYAARHGYDNIVEMLLEHKADIINIQTSSGYTALHLAAINKHIAVITVLLNKGANINIANNDRYTPAHYLKYLEHLKLENLNIDHLNLNTDVNNMCLAVIIGDISVVNTLLTEGFDVNALDHNGWTALHLAARHGYDNIVEMLLEHKADIINIQTSSGSTALHLASMYQHKKVVKVLLDNELIDISISDNNGNTPYSLAQKEYYCLEIIDLFQSKQHTSETGSLKTNNTAISNNLADCGLKFNPSLNSESLSDFQQPELHEKQYLNTLPINTNNDQGEVSSLYKQEIYKEKLSIAKKLLESGIIVDIIIKCVGLSEETVEKLRKDNVDFNNDKELVTQSKSLESSRNVLDEEEYPGIKYDVPGDGNCLFWSIFYAYLFPVRNSNKEFQKRFNKMFPDHDYNSLQDVQNKFQSLELDDLKNQDQDFILLIQKLRRRAYDEVKNSIDTTDQIHVTPSKKGVQHRQWAEAMAKADYNGSAYIANNYWGEEKAINALACLLDIKIKEQHSNQHYPYNLCNPLNETGHQNLLPVESDIEVTLLNINGHYNFYYKNQQCNSSHTESDVQTDNDGMATKSKQLSNDDKGLQTSINDTNAVNIFNLSKYSITNTKENINIRDSKSKTPVDLTKDQNNQKLNFQSELSSQQLANDCTIPISTINDRGEVRLYDNQTVNKEKYSTAKRVLNFSERALVSNTNTYNNKLATIEIDISSDFIIEKLNIKRNLKSNKSLGDHIIPISIFSKIITQFFQNQHVVNKAEYFYKIFIKNYKNDQNIGQIIEKIKDKKIPQEIEKCFQELISSIIIIWDQGLTSKYYGPKTQKELASEGGKVSSIGKKIGTILSENTLPKNFDEFKNATTEIKSHLLETIDLPSIIRKDINDQSEVQNYIQNILFISCTIIENKLKYQDKNNIKIIKNALETRKTLEKNKLLKYVKSIIQHKYEDEIVKIVKILEEFLEQKIQWIEVQKLLKVEIYNLIKWYFKEIIINVREHLQLFVLILNMRTSFCDEEEGDYQRFMNDLYDEENLAESLLNKQKSILDDRKTVLQGMYSDKPIDQYYSEPTESTSGSNGKYYDITGTDHQDSTFTFEQYLNNQYGYNWRYDISNNKGIKVILDHLLKVNSKIHLFDDSEQRSKINEINNEVSDSIKQLIIKSEHSYPEQAPIKPINCYVIIIKDHKLASEQNIIKISLIAIKYEDEKVLLQETDILNVNEESNKTIINLDSPFINNGQVEYKSTVLCNDGNDFKYKQPMKMENVISSIQNVYNPPRLQFKLNQHLEVINSQCIQANTLVINYYLEQFKKIQHILNTHHNNTLLQEEDINKLTDDTFDKSPLEMYMFYLLDRYDNCSSIPKPKLEKLIQNTYRYNKCQAIWDKCEQITSTDWYKNCIKEVYNPAQEKLTLSHLSTNSNSTWHNNDDNNKLLLGDSTDVTVL